MLSHGHAQRPAHRQLRNPGHLSTCTRPSTQRHVPSRVQPEHANTLVNIQMPEHMLAQKHPTHAGTHCQGLGRVKQTAALTRTITHLIFTSTHTVPRTYKPQAPGHTLIETHLNSPPTHKHAEPHPSLTCVGKLTSSMVPLPRKVAHIPDRLGGLHPEVARVCGGADAGPEGDLPHPPKSSWGKPQPGP